MSAPQSGADRPPEVLIRFRQAVLAMGTIGPRDCDGVYRWRASGAAARATIALLWPHLGAVKRRQAAAALRDAHLSPVAPSRHVQRRSVLAEERAWAAGFIDAEGSFGLVRAAARADGTRWYRIRVSVSQRGEVGRPPAVLRRLRTAAGTGRTEVHGDADDFKWVAEGARAVRSILDRVAPYVGEVKRRQAEDALARFLAQRRLHGDRHRCARGHRYDYRYGPERRSRPVCLSCRRLVDRARRAAAGVSPRQFKDVARRYTD